MHQGAGVGTVLYNTLHAPDLWYHHALEIIVHDLNFYGIQFTVEGTDTMSCRYCLTTANVGLTYTVCSTYPCYVSCHVCLGV